VTPPICSGSRFRNRIFDLNQIKNPRSQTNVQLVHVFLQSNRTAVAGRKRRQVRRQYKVGIVMSAMVGWNVGF